ncbi:uncharacterized DUF497 family protein [Saccharothrix coeruleofusca]|uniref:hypothetical protein n=1 Tax=Saccharothrix coeruleofusca TaxID=33919 RepID=UPI001AEB881D|nr:hypothetical protein [Saccharothrix coeruleofusca]MBP2334118.1 uncharacterized DUF497 family protein [Saccharothrix coeruleofusca]
MREIHWTDESEAHIARHQVSPDEVEQVVYTRPRLTRRGREDVTEVYGQTDAGCYLLVILSEALVGGHFVVTARDMTQQERRTFDRKAN